MASTFEVQAKITADTSALSAGFVKAQSIAATAGKQIERKLGLKDAFKGMVTAFGLSIENLGTKLGEALSGGSKSDWQSVLDTTAETGRIIEEQLSRRISLESKLNVIQQQRIAASQQASAPRANAGSAFGFTRFQIPFGLGGTETESEAEQRQADARKRMAEFDTQAVQLKEQIAALNDKIAESETEIARQGMSDEERLNEMRIDAVALEKKLADERQAGRVWQVAKLALLEKEKEIAQFSAKLEERKSEELERQLKARQQLTKEYLKAVQKRDEAAAAIPEAKNEALRFTLDEAAEGERGNLQDYLRANQIKKDEEMARRLHDTGGTVDEFVSARQLGFGFAPAGAGRTFKRDARFFFDRAQKLREGFEGLRKDERNPFSGVEGILSKSQTELEQINEKLSGQEI